MDMCGGQNLFENEIQNTIVRLICTFKGSDQEIIDFVPEEIFDERKRKLLIEFKDGSFARFSFQGKFEHFKKQLQEAYLFMQSGELRECEMAKQNCWEVKKCGRQLGGENVEKLGVCPASIPGKYDEVNGGQFGGRFCWAISGTFCNGEAQGSFAKKFKNCIECPFFLEVQEEEGREFVQSPGNLKRV